MEKLTMVVYEEDFEYIGSLPDVYGLALDWVNTVLKERGIEIEFNVEVFEEGENG